MSRHDSLLNGGGAEPLERSREVRGYGLRRASFYLVTVYEMDNLPVA
jgi:hypothetical protein